MRILLRSPALLFPLLLLAVGCETPWYQVEPAADALIPPTNPGARQTSRAKLARRIGEPCDVPFFGDQAEYMGDNDGYRYVHVRDIFKFWGFLGEHVYRVPASQWPMEHPMSLTFDASQWQDVTWMDADAPQGVRQNPFLHITPGFPVGAPATQPAMTPATTTDFTTRPSPAEPATTP